MRVELNHLSQDNWVHFLRGRDLKQILNATPEPLYGPVLEIGCGDGYLTTLLRQHFGEVFPIDIQPRSRVNGLSVANAEMLPFPDNYFGFIFSSNVLEHVENLTHCFEELGRVIRDNGIMIHTMPTPTWKVLQLALQPLHLLLHTIPSMGSKLIGAGNKTKLNTDISSLILPNQTKSEASKDKQLWSRLHTKLWPPIHGVAPSHFEEIKRFRVNSWVDRFQEGRFDVYRTAPLYLHTGYRWLPYRALIVREIISSAGFSSVMTYWVKKK